MTAQTHGRAARIVTHSRTVYMYMYILVYCIYHTAWPVPFLPHIICGRKGTGQVVLLLNCYYGEVCL